MLLIETDTMGSDQTYLFSQSESLVPYCYPHKKDSCMSSEGMKEGVSSKSAVQKY